MGDPTRTGAWANLEESVGEMRAIIPATALGATAFFLVGIARFAGILVEASYYPHSALAGAADNTRRHRVYNRKADASGTAVMADLQYNAGVDLVAKVKKPLTVSPVTADKTVAAGDVIEFNSAHVGTGLADPGGLLVLKFDRSN
jgi:hypothetical protein